MASTATINTKADLDETLSIFLKLRKKSVIKKRETIYGIPIVLGIALSWVGATQFTKSTYSSTFHAPWFIVWFSTSWMSVCFPVISLVYRLVKGQGFRTTFAKAQTVFGERGLCPYTLFSKCLPFAVLWAICNYMYTKSLSLISATDVTALFSSAPAFVFVLSLALLPDEEFSWHRLLATITTIAGIVVVAYSNGFTGPSIGGVLLAVGSAILAAMYKVTFKIFIGNASIAQVSLFLTCLGLLNLLCFWPVMEVMYFAHFEKIHWYRMPWQYLCGHAVLALLFNFFINFGIALTFPLFISLGTVLGIPINAVADLIWRHQSFSALKGLGAFMIIVGFLLLSFSKNKHTRETCNTCSAPRMDSALNVREISE